MREENTDHPEINQPWGQTRLGKEKIASRKKKLQANTMIKFGLMMHDNAKVEEGKRLLAEAEADWKKACELPGRQKQAQ